MAQVVEREDDVGQHQRHVREPDRVRVGLGQPLDGAHAVVAEEADRAARERRQAVHRRLAVARHLGGGERVRVAAVGQAPADDAARLVADERPAADALPLLGGLQQERRAGAAQLQERGDGRLAVLDERVRDRDEVVLPRQGPGLLERDAEGDLSATAAKQHPLRVGEAETARAQQHGEVVEHVGGLLGDPLVGLLADRAHDLLGLLRDLLARERRVGEQRGGVGALGQLGGARGDRALQAGQRLVRRGRLELAVVEARALAGVAGGAVRHDERQHGVGVAVVAQRLDGLGVARGRALAPQLVARAAPQVQLAGRARGLERLGVHVREREDLARLPVLDHAGHQPALVVGDRLHRERGF